MSSSSSRVGGEGGKPSGRETHHVAEAESEQDEADLDRRIVPWRRGKGARRREGDGVLRGEEEARVGEHEEVGGLLDDGAGCRERLLRRRVSDGSELRGRLRESLTHVDVAEPDLDLDVAAAPAQSRSDLPHRQKPAARLLSLLPPGLDVELDLGPAPCAPLDVRRLIVVAAGTRERRSGRLELLASVLPCAVASFAPGEGALFAERVGEP